MSHHRDFTLKKMAISTLHFHGVGTMMSAAASTVAVIVINGRQRLWKIAQSAYAATNEGFLQEDS